jgi:hypothetical protein
VVAKGAGDVKACVPGDVPVRVMDADTARNALSWHEDLALRHGHGNLAPFVTQRDPRMTKPPVPDSAASGRIRSGLA